MTRTDLVEGPILIVGFTAALTSAFVAWYLNIGHILLLTGFWLGVVLVKRSRQTATEPIDDYSTPIDAECLEYFNLSQDGDASSICADTTDAEWVTTIDRLNLQALLEGRQELAALFAAASLALQNGHFDRAVWVFANFVNETERRREAKESQCVSSAPSAE